MLKVNVHKSVSEETKEKLIASIAAFLGVEPKEVISVANEDNNTRVCITTNINLTQIDTEIMTFKVLYSLPFTEVIVHGITPQTYCTTHH